MIIREFLVKLGLDVNAASFAEGHVAARGIELALAKIVETSKALVRATFDLIQGTAESAKELRETAQATGLSTDALQELRRAAMMTGVDAGQLDIGIFRLSRTMLASKKAGGEQAAVFSKLGVRARDASGKLRSTDDVLMDLAESFSKMPDGAEKSALAMGIFGRSGARLVPMLNAGREGLAEFRGETTKLTKEQIDQSEQLVLTEKRIGGFFAGIRKGLAAEVIPAVSDAARVFYVWLKSNKAVMKSRIEVFAHVLTAAVKGVVAAFRWLVAHSTIVSAVLVMLAGAAAGLVVQFLILKGAAIAAAAQTAAAWLLAAAPFLAIGAAIAGVAALIYGVYKDVEMYQKYGDKADTVTGRIMKAIKTPVVGEPWFITALRDLNKLIDDALAKIAKLKKMMGFSDEELAQPGTEEQAARERIEKAVPKTRVGWKGSLWTGWFGEIPKTAEEQAKDRETFIAQHPQTAAAAGINYTPHGGFTQPVMVSPQVHMTVNAAPGQSAEEIANTCMSRLDAQLSSMCADAAASAVH